jgi:hypothetical protein
VRSCASPNCLNNAAPKKNYCPTCISRRWRAANPEMAAYNNLKTNAKRRGIGFFLTFEEFYQWAWETMYMALRGIDAEDMTIDRKKPHLGYRAGNLQMLTNRENARKGKREAWIPVRQTKEEAGTPF